MALVAWKMLPLLAGDGHILACGKSETAGCVVIFCPMVAPLPAKMPRLSLHFIHVPAPQIGRLDRTDYVSKARSLSPASSALKDPLEAQHSGGGLGTALAHRMSMHKEERGPPQQPFRSWPPDSGQYCAQQNA
jgi:hypothetical protein